MTKYLVKIKPLEPYFFGDENTIRIGEENRYYVSSLLKPSATTIMGMLRYTVLKNAGVLKTDREYNCVEKELLKKLIGEKSFEPNDNTDYGVIKGVSPLFLMSGNDIYIKLPLNHKMHKDKKDKNDEKIYNTQYTPFEMGCEALTSYKTINLPQKGEFDPKKTVSDDMYVNINTGDIIKDGYKDGFVLFDSFEKITCKKYSKKEGFMKKIFRVLNKDFCFAVVVEIDEDDEKVNFDNKYTTTCYMGREKSTFLLEFSEGFSLENKIAESNFAKMCGQVEFGYALGDIVVKESPTYSDFAMVQTQNLRYLTTDGGKYIKRNEKLYNVISAGSVFYKVGDIKCLGNDKFGLNKIITFGGNENGCKDL